MLLSKNKYLTAAGGAEMTNLMEQCGGGSVSEDQGGEAVNVFWTNIRGRQESLQLHRYGSIKVNEWNNMKA